MLNQKCKNDLKYAKNIENTLNDNLNELNNFNNLIQKRLTMNKLIEKINSYLMKKKEINLINFYTENNIE